jgi:hypothetical protein
MPGTASKSGNGWAGGQQQLADSSWQLAKIKKRLLPQNTQRKPGTAISVYLRKSAVKGFALANC